MKRLTLTLGIIAILALGAQLSYNVNSFPGFHGGSQCGICHNEPMTAWDVANANVMIDVDGIDTEAIWGDNDDTNMYIPLGGPFGFKDSYTDVNGTNIEVPYFARLKVSQNSTHIFFYVRLHDNSVEGGDIQAALSDKFAMLFNIDQEEFTLPAAYPWGWANMGSTVADQGSQDLVVWSPDAAADGAESGLTWNTSLYPLDVLDGDAPVAGWEDRVSVTSNVWDSAYGGTGTDTNDWTVGAYYGNQGEHYEVDYGIELVRPLETADSKDVQFKYDGLYEFAIARWNNSNSKDHYVSFEHAIWVKGTSGVDPSLIPDPVTVEKTVDGTTTTTITESKSDSPFNTLFGLFGMVSVGLAVIFVRRKK
ncbi:MAG: hypothetical protein ACXAB7_00890 [Candidatus Kariarchaeaceae archaeon]